MLPAAFTLLSLEAVAAAEVRTHAEFQPAQVEVGQVASYTITIEGTGNLPPLQPPSVSGLAWIGTTRQTSFQFYNGQTTQTVSIRFDTAPQSAGTYTVPAWSAVIDGTRASFPEATLSVVPASARNSSTTDDRQGIPLNEAVFLRLADFPESAYVGQAVEARIDLYILDSLREQNFSKPTPESSDFITLGQQERYNRRPATYNGRNYTIYSFPVSLCPLKAGTLDISYHQVVTVGVPRNIRRRGSYPNDPIFDHLDRVMGVNMEFREVSLASPPVSIVINELPQTGRPASFNGAIGHFEIDSVSIDSDQLQTGDPAKVTYSIIGTGNLVRVQPPALAGENWRVLSPKAEFLSNDPLEIRGRKTFSYTLIPESNQIEFTPNFEFSYFDPSAKAYQTITVNGFPVKVTGNPTRKAREDNRLMTGTSQSDADRLLPLRSDWEPLVSSITPPFLSPVFISSQLISLLTLAIAFGIVRHRWKLRSDAEFARRSRLLKKLRNLEAKARKAMSAGAADAALTDWHDAIRCAVALNLPDCEPESITQQDVSPLLSALTDDEQSLLLTLFNAADATHYGGAQAVTINAAASHALIAKLRSLPRRKPSVS